MNIPFHSIGRRWLIFIPVASIMYMLAFLDRTNLSFILPYMGDDLALNNEAKGLASGIFFLGYLVLQIPAALLAERWSARKTILILLFCWGAAAIWTGLVRSRDELMLARFVLGIFEGGVQPATLVLMLRWFPQREKARAGGFWLLCIPLSAIFAAPLTGVLMEHFHWRTVLILEGLSPMVWAIVWLVMIRDSPANAWWMSQGEKAEIAELLAQDEKEKQLICPARSPRWQDALLNRQVVQLIAAWFLYCAGFYGFTLWMPQVIAGISHGAPGLVGFLTALPFISGLIGMIVISVLADKNGLRKTSAFVPMTLSATALLAGQFVHIPWLQFILLCVVASCLFIHGVFFALPPLVLRREILPLSLGIIGGLGNLGGFLGPWVVGSLIDMTGSVFSGFLIMAAAMLGCGAFMAAVTPGKPSSGQVASRADDMFRHQE